VKGFSDVVTDKASEDNNTKHKLELLKTQKHCKPNRTNAIISSPANI
jgi:hypothetical protein